MDIRSQRMARGLSHVLTVLLVVCGFGLLVLVPATIFAFWAPDTVLAGMTPRADGQAIDPRTPLLSGTLMLYAVAALVVATAIFFQLRRMMGSVAAGNPFDRANVTRLRIIAGAMGAMVVFQAISALVTPAAFKAALNLRDGGFDFGMFLGMLVVLVLAEVFREGARLREDADMTV